MKNLKFRPSIFKPVIDHGVNGLKGMKFAYNIRLNQNQEDGEIIDKKKNDRIDVSNQAMEGNEGLTSITNHFPSSLSIGYGSGVFQQKGYEGETPQIDIINIVDDTRDFHRQNLLNNSHHYSGLKYLGLGMIEKFQNWGPVHMYFNPFVNIEKSMVKYGIILKSNSLKDLVEWDNFYVAGRLQKPVKFIYPKEMTLSQRGDFEIIQLANQYNLFSGLIVSLLINKSQTITESKIYENITSLSYLGDPRMKVGGENPNKVKNIVSKQLLKFKKLYSPMMQYLIDNKYLIVNNSGDEFVINLSSTDKLELIKWLPKNFRNVVLRDEKLLNDNKKLSKVLKSTLVNLVGKPSLIQSIKGIFTAGITKTLKYMIAKRMKYQSKR